MWYVIFTIICAIVGGIIAYQEECHCNRLPFYSHIWNFIKGFLVGVLFACPCMIFFWLFADNLVARSEIITVKRNIEALNDNNGQKGDFFLGCGNINSEFKYAYYEQTKFGFKLKTISADSVTIMYTSRKAYVEYIYQSLPKDSKWKPYVTDTKLRHVVIHIPKGSINNEYRLDAE